MNFESRDFCDLTTLGVFDRMRITDSARYRALNDLDQAGINLKALCLKNTEGE